MVGQRRDRGPHPCSLVPYHDGEALQGTEPFEPNPIRSRRPYRHTVLLDPMPELAIRGDGGGKAERGPHRSPQYLGVRNVGRSLQEHGTRRAQRKRRAEQCADVSGILHTVEDQHRKLRVRAHVGQPVSEWLYDAEDPLRGVGRGQPSQLPIGEILDRNGVGGELFGQLPASGRAPQGGTRNGPPELHPCPERFFNEPHALGHRETATLAALSLL